MPRTISDTLRAGLDEPHSDHHVVVFAELTHAGLSEPIRVADDVVDYWLNSVLWVGMPFELETLTDSDAPPTGRIAIPNVDRRIGEAVIALDTSPNIRLEVYSASEWGDVDADNARSPLGTPAVELSVSGLRLTNIDGDATTISGTLGTYDFVGEPWPMTRATKGRLPGLYR